MSNEVVRYDSFIRGIKELVYNRQYEAMKKVNIELLQLYWEIGKEIDKKLNEKGWGKSVVETLAKELQKEFPAVKGFTTRNLWLMKQLYTEYGQNEKLQPLVAEISWTNNTVIMQKCKDLSEREFYLKMTKRYGWTRDVLINNIENKAFEKYLINQNNFDTTVAPKYQLQAKLAVKDDYNFDFLEMGIQHSEAELEAGIVNNIRGFLTEMGGDFSFIGNQHHLNVAGDDYYIDLLLYHRRLRSLIIIDLKIGEFKPEYAGKMQFYLTAIDETMKLPEENPAIGIIICKSKNRTKVEYTLKTTTTPIGVATYSLHDRLPDNLRELLPSPDEIATIVKNFGGEEDE